MSLTNPVVSDLIVATYERDRHVEVEQLRVRRNPDPRTHRSIWSRTIRAARGIGVTGAMVLVHAGRRQVAVSAGPGGDGRLC